jgi:hypothetical protein
MNASQARIYRTGHLRRVGSHKDSTHTLHIEGHVKISCHIESGANSKNKVQFCSITLDLILRRNLSDASQFDAIGLIGSLDAINRNVWSSTANENFLNKHNAIRIQGMLC